MLLSRETIADLRATAQHLASRPNPTGEEITALKTIHRQLMRGDFIYWCEQASHLFCVPGEDPTPAPHHRIIMYWVDRIIRGETKRIIMSMPPGHAKSTYTIKLGIPFMMAAFPKTQDILASSSEKLIHDQSAAIRLAVDTYGDVLGITAQGDNREHWDVSNGSKLLTVSARSKFQGHRGDRIWLDDLIGGQDDVRTEAKREDLFSWMNANLLGRTRNVNSSICLINTRWHESDLSALILERKNSRKTWEYINLQAVWEEPYDEPEFPYGLGRKAGSGDLLWDAQAEKYLEAREGSEFIFQAQYQGQPVPRDGNFFKAHLIKTIAAAPATKNEVRAWDFAGSMRKHSDYTVGVKMAERDGLYVITEIIRFKGDHNEVREAVLNTAHRDGKKCRIIVPQDAGSSGKAIAEQFVAALPGYSVGIVVQTGKNNSKTDRARGLGAQVDGGNVRIVEEIKWSTELMEEMTAFPYGKHDDIVDAAACAFNELVIRKPKPRKPSWSLGTHFQR